MTTFEARWQVNGLWCVVKVNDQESETLYTDLPEQTAKNIVHHLNRDISEERDTDRVTRVYHKPTHPMWEYLDRISEDPEDSA